MSSSPTTAEVSTPVHSSAKQTAAMLARTPRAVAQHPVKTKHRKINKQHPEFELTYDMMLGIRTVVSKTEAQHRGELSAPDYKESVKLRFPGRGSIITPAHEMRDFKFKDYCPMVFKKIRESFFINPADYLMCVCGNFQYLEFISNSKSGQFFFYTHDRQFMIKTMSKAECKFLRSILPAYYEHIQKNPNTLLTRFFGMHKVKPHKKTQRHFLIMGSVFYTNKYIHTVYDLKGSTQGRYATAKEKLSGANCVYKDNDFLDFNQHLQLTEAKAKQLNDQLASDVEFLRKLDIMDYSLLLGIHYRDRPVPGGFDAKFDQSMAERDTTRSHNFDVTQTLVLNPDHPAEPHQSVLPHALTPVASAAHTADSSSQSERRTPPGSTNHQHPGNAILQSINPVVDSDSAMPAESPRSPTIAAPKWHDETHSTNENDINLPTKLEIDGDSVTSTITLDDLHVEVNRPESASITASIIHQPSGQLSVKLPPADEADLNNQSSSAPTTSTAASVSNQPRVIRHQHQSSLSGIHVPQLLSVPSTPGTAAIATTPAPSPNHAHPSHHGHTGSIEFKRQSAYGLPKRYNKTSKPSDIAFDAPEFEPVHVLDSPRATRLRNDTAHTRTSMGGHDSVVQHPSPNFVPSIAPSVNESLSPVQQHEILDDNVLLNYHGGICSVDEQANEGREIYFMGIIDILTVYNLGKWVENRYKRVQLQKGISAVSPRKYAERFKAFIAEGIRAITCPQSNTLPEQSTTSPVAQPNGVVNSNHP